MNVTELECTAGLFDSRYATLGRRAVISLTASAYEIAFFEGEEHIFGDGSCDQQTFGVAGACHELESESAHIPGKCTEDVEVKFAGGASSGGDLSYFK